MRDLWLRVKEAWHVLRGTTHANTAIEVRRHVASIEIRLLGNTVQTDMNVTVAVLEQMANGIGRTLVPMPSKDLH